MVKPPFTVTLLTLIVLTFTTWSGIRLFQTMRYWNILISYNSQPGPLYMTITSLVWVLIGTALTFGLIIGNSRWLLFLKLTVIFFTIWNWIDRLMLQNSLLSIQFPLAITVFMLLFIAMLINHKNTKFYFKLRDTHDR